jgi:chemotaxis protein methyltransferase CheR
MAPEMPMRRPLPDALLADVSEFVAQHIGLHFPPARWRDVERGLAAAAREFGLPDAETCARALLAAPLTHAQVEVLASHLTVGETYFFREKNSFAALEAHILPELLRARRGAEQRLRIWCAGCCTGEEAYSVAMLIDRLIPDAEAWNLTILATDINPRFLNKAAEGVYGEWSFRDTPGWIRARYFTRLRKGRFELQPRIRKRVTFSHLNLADDAYPSLINNTNAMDVILCRNVLMYFTAEHARRAAANFHRALVSGGWLVVSPTETSNSLFAPLSPVQFPGAVFYRKGGGTAPRPATFEAPPPASEAPFLPLAAAPPAELAQETAAVESPPAPARAPEDPGAHARAARLCAGEGRLGEAIEWCEKAIAAERLNPAHYYLLATIRQEQGQLDAAAQSLARALYLDADFALAHFALGNLRLSQGRRRDAERHLANALAVLRGRAQDEILPESEGLTAGRLAEIIASVRAIQPPAAA